MTRVRLLGLLLVMAAFVYSCSGDTGPAGPAGRKGNANVIVYQYGTQTTTTGNINYTFLASQGLVDSSMVLAYYNPSTEAATAWYPVPGLGSSGMYMTRSLWYQTIASPSTYSFRVFLLTPSGSATYLTSTTFTKFKIILVPASEINSVTSRGILNLSDYNAVADYLGLSE
ncbi:MAG: hypothetical protein ABR899_00030 [Candidatus Krumholzibacteriaceae bacterium]